MNRTSLKKYLSISPTLIKTNFRNYWYIGLFTFFIFFFKNVFGTIVVDNKLSFDYIYNILLLKDFVTWVYLAIFPLITACLVMNYLHNPIKAMALSAQPYSRGKVFTSHVVSGWLMMVIPIVVIAILTGVVLSSGLFTPENEMAAGLNIIELGAFTWLGKIIAIITFIYAVCILACSLSGTVGMSIMVTVLLAFLPVAIVWAFEVYMSNFIYGYSEIPEFVLDIINATNPVIAFLLTNTVTAAYAIHSFFYGLFILAVAAIANSLTHYERIGETILFRGLEILFAGTVMTGVSIISGTLTYGMFESKTSMFIGLICGAILGFIGVRVLVEKSIKILNKRGIITLILGIVMICLFTMITVVDVFGFTKRIPKVDSIKYVDTYYVIDNYDVVSSDGTNFMNYEHKAETDDRELIEKVHALEEYIIENKLYELPEDKPIVYVNWYTGEDFRYDGKPISECSVVESVKFNYKLANGNGFSRSYTILIDDTVVKMINDILSDDAYISLRDPSEDLIKQITILYVYPDDLEETEECAEEECVEEDIFEGTEVTTKTVEKNILIDSKDYAGVFEAFNKDRRNLVYAGLSGSDYSSFGWMEIETRIPVEEKGMSLLDKWILGEGNRTRYHSLKIAKADTNLISFLKEKGYI